MKNIVFLFRTTRVSQRPFPRVYIGTTNYLYRQLLIHNHRWMPRDRARQRPTCSQVPRNEGCLPLAIVTGFPSEELARAFALAFEHPIAGMEDPVMFKKPRCLIDEPNYRRHQLGYIAKAFMELAEERKNPLLTKHSTAATSPEPHHLSIDPNGAALAPPADVGVQPPASPTIFTTKEATTKEANTEEATTEEEDATKVLRRPENSRQEKLRRNPLLRFRKKDPTTAHQPKFQSAEELQSLLDRSPPFEITVHWSRRVVKEGVEQKVGGFPRSVKHAYGIDVATIDRKCHDPTDLEDDRNYQQLKREHAEKKQRARLLSLSQELQIPLEKVELALHQSRASTVGALVKRRGKAGKKVRTRVVLKEDASSS